MRKPRQRMPVAGVPSGKSPFQTDPSQAILDNVVISDIIRVVEIDKIEVEYLGVDGNGGQDEEQINVEVFWRRRDRKTRR